MKNRRLHRCNLLTLFWFSQVTPHNILIKLSQFFPHFPRTHRPKSGIWSWQRHAVGPQKLVKVNGKINGAETRLKENLEVHLPTGQQA